MRKDAALCNEVRVEHYMQTTAPLSGTGPESVVDGLAIRWVHPRPRGDTALKRGSLTLGREPTNEVVLDGITTSRRHAQILRRGNTFAIRDLGGQNGVFCDGSLVAAYGVLVPGTVIRLGEWIGVVVVVETGGSALPFSELIPGLFGSGTLARQLRRAGQYALSTLNVLIQGATGTGKELVARGIHAASGRGGRLVAVNCAALTESLVDAELFGHERGAFSGAERARPGLVREAQGGTLFLDEVGDLSLGAQAKLLRAIQEREVIPVGSSQAQSVDFRLISATHRDLSRMVESGAFRADLLARLAGGVLELPALDQRREDVLPLFRHFSTILGYRPQISVRLAEALCLYAWPMNVRQLEVTARRMVALYGSRTEWRRRHFRRAMASEQGLSRDPQAPASQGDEPIHADREAPSLTDAALLHALAQARGNVTHAARILGVSKHTVYRRIKERGIALEQFREV